MNNREDGAPNGQQGVVRALRRGEIDMALTAYGAEALSHDFYTHKLATVPSVVVLPFDHPLASQKQLSISQLRNESFVGVPDDAAPGKNQKVVQLCRQFGEFRPRFVSVGKVASVTECLMATVNEGAILLSPAYVAYLAVANAVMIPIAEKQATWDLFVVWQRGKIGGPLRTLLDLLQTSQRLKRFRKQARSHLVNS